MKKFDKFVDKLTRKTMHKSANVVKEEVKAKVDEVTTGENGQKLLIAAVAVSAVALVLAVGIGLKVSGRDVVINIYNK